MTYFEFNTERTAPQPSPMKFKSLALPAEQFDFDAVQPGSDLESVYDVFRNIRTILEGE